MDVGDHFVKSSSLKALLVLPILFANFARAESEFPNEPPYVSSENDGELTELIDPSSDEVIESSGATPPMTKETTPEPSQSVSAPLPMSKKVRKIYHPDAVKGLQMIERGGAYYYKPQISAKNDQTTTVKFGMASSPVIKASDGVDFKTMYTDSSLGVFGIDYEQKIITPLGPLGIQYGFGIITATGHGRFSNANIPAGDCTSNCTSLEKYTFYALPISVGAVYRLEFTRRQWFAPYFAAGGTYFLLAELRDDGQKSTYIGAPAVYGSAGAMINVTSWSRETAFTLDSEYGISNLWITGEYRRTQTSNESLNLSSNTMNFGISVDY